MATVAEVVARYRADTSAYVGPVRQATQATQEFARAMPSAAQGTDKMSAAAVGLSAAAGTILVGALMKAGGVVKNFATQGIQAAASYEQTVISIEGLFMGMGMTIEAATAKTKSYLADLRDFAATTPFELPQTLDAVKRLLSIGYAADDVKNRLLPAIGDITAALGQPAASISAVVYAFGQMKSAGRVLSQDLMQVGNALPGFNAKMEIAKTLFNGDVAAMTDAMEKGTLDSSKAIDALITAMQKFPGAAGAMARQSKTLLGVISTFKDEINNALIDGIYPYLPALSEALLGVLPAVKAMAEAFGNNLGPALIQGADLLSALVPVITSVVPPLLSLAGSFGGLLSVLTAMAPVAAVIGSGLGALATALNALPGPIKTLIGAFLAWRLIMAKMPATWKVFALEARTAMVSAGVQIRAFGVQVAGTAAIAGTSFMGMKVAAQIAGMGIGAAFRAAGVAAKGLIMSLGPVGWALTAATVAFEIFSSRSAAAEERVRSLTDALSEQGPAAEEAAAKVIASALMAEQWGGKFLWIESATQTFQQLASAVGVSMDEVVAAVMQGGTALDQLKEKFTAAGDAGIVDPLRASEAVGAIQAQADALNDARGQLEQNAEATDVAAAAVQRIAAETEVYNRSTLNAAQRQAALTAVQETATAAVQALRSAFEALNRVISNEASRDNAIRSTKELTAALKESEGGIKGNSTAALDNRAKIRDAANAWIAWAQQTNDPIKQQERLKQGQEAVTKALKAADLNPKDSKILDAFKEQQEKSDEVVDKFKEQIPVANQYGIDIGNNFIEGIIQQLEARKDEVSAAAANVGAAANAGAQAAIDSNSPSKTAMKIAGYWIQGLVLGLSAGEAKAYFASGKAARRVIAGWRDTMNRYAPGLAQEWGRALQDAVWAVEEAADRIADAEKSLQEARKDGKAREVAAAERELARAYRDQADAIRAAAVAKKNYEALRRLATMKPVAATRIGAITAEDIISGSGIDDALQQARTLLVDRAIRAGMTRDAANAYADAVLATFTQRIEVRQRRLNRLLRDLEKIRQQIDKLEQEQATRTEAGKTIAEFITDRFGEPSEFDKAYNSASVSIDQAISLFDKFKDLIAQRYTGLDTNEDDVMVKYLEDQTTKLIGLIKQRDEIKGRLDAAQRDLDDLLKKREDMEKRVADSIRGFFKPSGKIGTADEYILGLQQRVDATKKYMADIETLRARGVAQDTINQILDMGVENGGALAGALATASDAQLTQVADLTAQAESMATTFGTTQAGLMYNSGIASQQALVQGIQKEYNTVIAEINTVVKGIENQFSMMKDTTLVAGEAAAKALLAGLKSQEQQILTYIQNLANQIRTMLLNAVNSVRPQPAPGGGGGGGGSGRGSGRAGVRARASFEGPSTPSVSPAATGPAVSVASGGVQVSVTVGADQSPQVVKESVRAAIQDALEEVARQARNARR